MKKIIMVMIFVLLIFNIVVADDYDITKYQVKVIVDGDEMDTFDYEQSIDLPGFIYQSRTMLPLKRTFSLFGIPDENISWNSEDRSVTVITNDYRTIWMQIDNLAVKLDGEIIETDVPAKIFNNRTFVPMAFISKLLEVVPTWDGETRTVYMNPSTYELDNFNLSCKFDRGLRFSGPTYNGEEEAYAFFYSDVYNIENGANILIYFTDELHDNALSRIAAENFLSTEDFKALSNIVPSYYKEFGDKGFLVIGDVGIGTVIIESSNVDIGVIEELVESMKGIE